MGYTPENNPYIPGDPYSYDLAWMVEEVKKAQGIEAASDENRKQAEAWAVGTIDGDPVTSDDPQYQNNSKFWSDDSFVSAEQSEAWAVGTIQGIPVTADKDQYENNSKYYADQASSDAADAHSDMLAAKDYADNIADPVSGLVTSWLTDHITNPSNPPIDTSLSVAGSAADAKATGDAINEISEHSRNLIIASKEGVSVSSNGTISANITTDVYSAPVESGHTYYVTTNDSSLICGFFTMDPFSLGAQSYNNSRIIQNPRYITAPISGYIAFRTLAGYATPQITESRLEEPYIKPIVATDGTLREYALNNLVPFDNAASITADKYIDYVDGSEDPLVGLFFAEYVVVGGGYLHYAATTNSPDRKGLAFYDSEGSYIVGYQMTGTAQDIYIPESAVILKATIIKTNDVSFSDYLNAINGKAVDMFAPPMGPLGHISDDPGMLGIFLNVGCIGDSLASGEAYWNEGGITQGADFYEYSWGQFLARQTGNTYYNWSRGGLTSKTWNSSTYATECFDGNHLCEAYIIGLGQNDHNQSMTIGSSADIDFADYNNNADTVYGNYAKIIQRIQDINPKAKIFVLTDMNPYVERDGYNAPMRDMPSLFSNVYLVDLQAYGSRYYNSPILSAQMRAGHYNAYGYKLCSLLISNYINWIILTQPSEFTQVELILTSHSWS